MPAAQLHLYFPADVSTVADSAKALEGLDHKREVAAAKAAENERKIRELGSLPQEAFDKPYRDRSIKVREGSCG